MKTTHFPLFATALALAASLGLVTTSQAQTRTWVSGGVGDDANPGSRAAPCKTFAGAISKTAAGGEIDVVDPGGFGSLTITKAITIDGLGSLSSVLVSGTPCITVNAGATDVVTLRNMSFNGTGTGTFGIRVLSAGQVRIENCVIFGGTTNGIDFLPTTVNTTLYVQNSHIHNMGGAGVFANPVGGGGKVVIENCIIESCGSGVFAGGGSMMLSDSTITGNTGAGLATSGVGSIITFHNNKIFGNNPDGNATSSLPLR